jgi:Holliday junction resolvase
MASEKSASQRGRASRNKGKVGEREVAEIIRQFGMDAARAQQFKGAAGAFDLNCPALEGLGFGVEVKNTKKALLDGWLAKAKESTEKPLILWKRERDGWYAVLPLPALLALICAIEQMKE